jgi:hypothetical protein
LEGGGVEGPEVDEEIRSGIGGTAAATAPIGSPLTGEQVDAIARTDGRAEGGGRRNGELWKIENGRGNAQGDGDADGDEDESGANRSMVSKNRIL